MQVILDRIIQFIFSVPTNFIVIGVVLLILFIFFKFTIKQCFKVLVIYAQLCLVLALFGITMPNFIEIYHFLVDFIGNMFAK